MYHTIVKRIARKNFERVNQHDFESLLKDCVPTIRHRFGGNHANFIASGSEARAAPAICCGSRRCCPEQLLGVMCCRRLLHGQEHQVAR